MIFELKKFNEELNNSFNDQTFGFRDNYIISKIEKSIEKRLKNQLTEPIMLMMLDATPQIWAESLSLFNLVLKDTETWMETKLKCMKLS